MNKEETERMIKEVILEDKQCKDTSSKDCTHKGGYNCYYCEKEAISSLFDLYKEQQKEIEKLEEQKRGLLVETYKKLDAQDKKIIKLKNDYIHKDKIRETIEDLEKHRIMGSDDFAIKVLKALLKENNNE